MDDPWGSPWASADAAPPNNSLLLNPPPKAFFGGTSLTHSPSPGPSPWADDETFSGWAAKSEHDLLDASPWATAGRDSPLRTPHLRSKTSSIFEKESTGSWPGSPALNPPPRSRASSVFRPPPSPDPWAADSPWLDATPRLPPPSADTTGHNNLKPEGAPLSRPGPSPITQSTATLPEEDEADGNAEPHESPSRPSSTFSTDGDGRVPERQDSPITSIDEEANLRPQQPSARKVTGKIALLVDKFDGLARAASEEPAELQRPASARDKSKERSRETLKSTTDDEPKTDSGVASVTSDDAREASVDNEQLNDPTAVSTSPDDRRDSLEESSTAAHSDTRRSASLPVQQLIEKFGPISFNIDLDGLQTIFSNISDDADPDSELPDRVISDSFTNLDQRRIWYRISRYGSMRKHNSGDDENYPRIQWATSDVHEETIKVVRRWKEEDSISGRPTFGLGKRTSGFNWDSGGTVPIEMDKIFGRKPRAATKSSIPTVTPRDSAELPDGRTARASTLPPNVLTGPPIGAKAFGWSSMTPEPSPTTLPMATGTTSSPKTDSARNSMSLPHAPAAAPKTESARNSLSLPPVPAVAPAVAPKQSPQEPLPPAQHVSTSRDEGEGDDDDDDEWGEMVASPTFARGLSLSSGFPDIGDPEPSSFKADTALPEDLGQTTIQQDTPEEEKSVDTGTDAPVSEQAAESTSLFSADTSDSVFTTDVPALETAAESTSLFSVERESQEIQEIQDQAPDPWAFADFSCFETPTPQPIQEQPVKAPIADKPIGPPVSVVNKLHTIPEMPTPATVILGPVQSSKKEEQEGMSQAVENIIQNLPDLSYMLR
ncbi:hypothetical protein PG997_014434 [Apiospora hydei]|uniref:Glucan 1, 4-alpha-glucosidase n=1 Tax=Apiospora hydei TaxID=1337664 RepID=A0ABR1UTV9_9PEZI